MIRGATAPSARARSTAPVSCATRSGKPATRSPIHTGYLALRPIALHLVQGARQGQPDNPRVGDLVIWGGGTHVGIYIGNGKAISTLTNGVRIHGVFAVTARFTAYLHTGMSTRPVS